MHVWNIFIMFNVFFLDIANNNNNNKNVHKEKRNINKSRDFVVCVVFVVYLVLHTCMYVLYVHLQLGTSSSMVMVPTFTDVNNWIWKRERE